jgi:hypothetical protein
VNSLPLDLILKPAVTFFKFHSPTHQR